MTNLLERDPTLALVISDFGRDAALRFCALLAEAERERVRGLLPRGAPFYDEHRRLTLAVIGDLPFAKGPTLRRYRKEGRSLDDGVLVGFPGGPPPESVTARLGVLALEAMEGPLRRGCRRVVVLLPCNTLAPTSWALEGRFGDAGALREMVEEAGRSPWPGLDGLVSAVVEGEVEVRFPTVPGAVAAAVKARGKSAVLPWGTESIVDVYKEAIVRAGIDHLRCLKVKHEERPIVLRAIRAAVGGTASERERAQRELEALAAEIERHLHGEVVIVEACTDLDYSVGMDSVAALVEQTVRRVYR